MPAAVLCQASNPILHGVAFPKEAMLHAYSFTDPNKLHCMMLIFEGGSMLNTAMPWLPTLDMCIVHRTQLRALKFATQPHLLTVQAVGCPCIPQYSGISIAKTTGERSM